MLETKYIDLSVSIEKGIKDGLWKERLPSVRQLSKELDADPATISKAFKFLSEKGIVTIQGNKGTYITQPGKGTKHKVIGLVGIKTDHPIHFEEFSIMEKTASENDYEIIGIAHKNDLFINNPGLLLKFPVDGYIFMYSSLTFEIAAFLRTNGVPFVSCNRPVGIPGVSWVDFDSEGSFEKSMRYLIGLGHKRIAYMEIYNPRYNYTERMLATYKKVLSGNGITFDKSLFISEEKGRYSIYGDDYLKMHNAYGIYCAEMIIKIKEKPTAALITYPGIAYSFIRELKKHGLNVPGDIAVMTHNYPNTKDDFLTTLFNDYRKRAFIAMKMLMDLIDSPYMEVKEELVEGKIVVKKSTCLLTEGKK